MTEDAPAQAAAEAAGDAAAAAEGSPFPALHRLRRRSLLVVAGVAAFAVLGAGSLLAGVATASNRPAPGPAVSVPPSAEPRPLPDSVPPAVAMRTCSVGEEAAHGELAELHAAVIRLQGSGPELLFGRDEGSPVPTGGVMKLYTAAAALYALGPDFRISTTVVEGSVPGSVILIGRGDATLSRLPEGQQSVYRDAPKLASLAQQTVESWADTHPGELITTLVVDSNYWSSGDDWGPGWPGSARTQGSVSRITALQVDGDRDDPKTQSSPRSNDPIGRATDAFVAALRAADPDGEVVGPDLAVTSGGAASGAALLAEVQSQPVRSLVQHMVASDDNTLAEMLARIVSRRSGNDGSSASAGGAVESALTAGYDGIPLAGLVVADGSGLSPQNLVPMEELAAFLALVWDGQEGLSDIRDVLSVAGESGALQNRYTGTDAAGSVSAKTGRIGTAAALAGIVEAEDGALLAFAVAAVREGVGTGAWAPMDRLVTGFYECGSNLAPV